MSDYFDVTRTYSYRNIAGRVLGWEVDELEVNWVDDDGFDQWGTDYVYSDTVVRFVWYGDDTVHVVDTSDLVLVEQDEDGFDQFCAGCGQIGQEGC